MDFKRLVFLFCLVNFFVQCQKMKTTKQIDMSQATIKVDSCGLYYKEHRLDLGTPLSDWEKILGKPSRKFETILDSFHSGTLTWDDKVIAVKFHNIVDGIFSTSKFSLKA